MIVGSPLEPTKDQQQTIPLNADPSMNNLTRSGTDEIFGGQSRGSCGFRELHILWRECRRRQMISSRPRQSSLSSIGNFDLSFFHFLSILRWYSCDISVASMHPSNLASDASGCCALGTSTSTTNYPHMLYAYFCSSTHMGVSARWVAAPYVRMHRCRADHS